MSVAEGGEVWILAGTKVPYVLRPLGNNGDELVGEPYLHGIMFGEKCSERKRTDSKSNPPLIRYLARLYSRIPWQLTCLPTLPKLERISGHDVTSIFLSTHILEKVKQ